MLARLNYPAWGRSQPGCEMLIFNSPIGRTLVCFLCVFLNATRGQSQTQSSPEFSREQIQFFEMRVRPVLVNRCGKCHGQEEQNGKLRLDSRAAILKGGDSGPAAVVGDPTSSRIIAAVLYANDPKMPPDGKLPESEIAALQEWVAAGLPWPVEAETTPNETVETTKIDPDAPLWSLMPIADPNPPHVAHESWCIDPIDRFVLSGLEQRGLLPNPPADKRTLIRRVTYDLTGLPPTPEEVDAFLLDNSADAYERLVERLLASPRYGVRWGRHWLDVARYADSNGLDENLAYVQAFRYRDYVVNAFNTDKPFDQFLREQLAGDLLPPSAQEQENFDRVVATGFLCIGAKMLAEDDPVKMEMDIVDEQVDTLGAAFLGMTIGCARCHDHKFDPVKSRDYYALAGIFKSTKTMDNFSVVAQWHERTLLTKQEREVYDRHQAELAKVGQKIKSHVDQKNQEALGRAKTLLADYLLAGTSLLNTSSMASRIAAATAEPSNGSASASLPSGVFLIEAESFVNGNVLIDTSSYGAGIGVILNKGEIPNFAEYEVELPVGHYQLEIRYAQAESRPVQISIDGNLIKSNAATTVTGSWNPDTQRWEPVGLVKLSEGKHRIRVEKGDGPFPHIDKLALAAISDTELPTLGEFRSAAEVAKEKGLSEIFLQQWVDYLAAEKSRPESVFGEWFRAAVPQLQTPDATANSGQNDSIALRVLAAPGPSSTAELATRYQSLLEEAEQAWQAHKSSAAGSKSDQLSDPVLEAFRQVLYAADGPLRLPDKPELLYSAEDQQALAALKNELAALEKSAPPAAPAAMSVEEGSPLNLKIHIRGSHLNLGDEVARGIPNVIAGQQTPPIPQGQSGRLELANQLTSRDNPLVSRVLVNRIWRWHFGEGLVRSTDNFGRLGELPSHPELLDHLASSFMNEKWSIKSLHRRILRSATYRMSAEHRPDAAMADPDNRLLWKFARRRLDAEEIRDAMLFVSGELDESLGGSLLKSKPREYVASTTSVNQANYQTTRRSIFLPVIRSALFDMYQVFDFPEPSVMSGSRPTTTIAPQALFMMNSQQMEQSSGKLAGRIQGMAAGDDRARMTYLFMTALGRPPREPELQRCLKLLDDFQSSLAVGGTAADPSQALSQNPAQNPSQNQSANRDPHTRAWQAVCRVLLSSNEFLYVE